jgi:hypothetical protein
VYTVWAVNQHGDYYVDSYADLTEAVARCRGIASGFVEDQADQVLYRTFWDTAGGAAWRTLAERG